MVASVKGSQKCCKLFWLSWCKSCAHYINAEPFSKHTICSVIRHGLDMVLCSCLCGIKLNSQRLDTQTRNGRIHDSKHWLIFGKSWCVWVLPLKLWCPNSKPRYFSWRGRKKDPDINGETSCEKLYTLISSHVSLDGKQLPEFTDTSDSLFDLLTPEKTIQVSFLVRYLTSFTGHFCVISSILQSSLRSSLWEQQDLILMWPVVSFI